MNEADRRLYFCGSFERKVAQLLQICLRRSSTVQLIRNYLSVLNWILLDRLHGQYLSPYGRTTSCKLKPFNSATSFESNCGKVLAPIFALISIY